MARAGTLAGEPPARRRRIDDVRAGLAIAVLAAAGLGLAQLDGGADLRAVKAPAVGIEGRSGGLLGVREFDGPAQLMWIRPGTLRPASPPLGLEEEFVAAFALSPDGRRMAVGKDMQGRIQLVDRPAPSPTWSSPAAGSAVSVMSPPTPRPAPTHRTVMDRCSIRTPRQDSRVRRGPARRPRRSPRSPRRRARTPRRRAPGCPRTGGRGRARSRSGSRGTPDAP